VGWWLGEARAAVVEEEGGIPVLVEMVEGGTSRQQEGAAAAGRARRARETRGLPTPLYRATFFPDECSYSKSKKSFF
jgi:hypothetical protein